MSKTHKSPKLHGVTNSKQNEEELQYLEDQIDPYSTTPPRQGDTRGYYEKLKEALFLRLVLGKKLLALDEIPN